MKKLFKRILPFALVVAMCLCMAAPASAATESEASTYMLVGDPIELNPEACRLVYYEYVACYGDYTDVTTALADTLSTSGLYTYSVAVSIASALGSIYFTTAMDVTYRGWQSGRGATLYVYDNSAPVIVAN